MLIDERVFALLILSLSINATLLAFGVLPTTTSYWDWLPGGVSDTYLDANNLYDYNSTGTSFIKGSSVATSDYPKSSQADTGAGQLESMIAILGFGWQNALETALPSSLYLAAFPFVVIITAIQYIGYASFAIKSFAMMFGRYVS